MNDFKVFMYHEIVKKKDFDLESYEGIYVNQGYNDKLPPPLFCFLEEFEKQMEYLYINNYRTLTLRDVKDFYYNSKPLPEKSVLLTFDDMYKSVLIHAYPILKKYNFHAVGFVVREWIFDDEKEYVSSKSVCMSRKELEVVSDVFEFANHTSALHMRSGSSTALMSAEEDELQRDLMSCESFVSTKRVFAYPFGIYSEELIKSLRELEFLLAFTTEVGSNTIDTDPLRLHRNGVFINCDIEGFKNML
jgi:peptidoglycan/xylan/chitin deacetylase (PgdA/CDA1 family)